MKFSFSSFLQWDTKESKVVFPKSVSYRIFNSIYLISYLIVATIVITNLVVRNAFGKNENGKEDIFDVSTSNENKLNHGLIYIIHTMYIGIVVLLVGCWVRLIQNHHEFVESVNMAIQNVLKYQGNSNLKYITSTVK